MALEKMSDQFQGLPMETLIGGPLTAACNAQVMLANSTATYINTVGFDRPADGTVTDQAGFARLRTVKFAFQRPREVPPTGDAGGDGQAVTEDVSLSVPLLSMVPVPNLQVDTVDVAFDMEVKSAEQSKDSKDVEASLDAKGEGRIGPFSLSVSVHGKVATHQENTRSSDNSAKYHVAVKATNHAMPEGLARVFDIMATSIAPVTTVLADKPADKAVPAK
ncbi:DUF2589 domain-containing protein [Amycolatopsis sp. NPDC051758]|jgi:hypothetical protein|uniref:DUF2589 domain-containing protein n=1 Tax=Amycolatopsis sp. NPDC051758 TaxID=3363935 RepID=UPI0037B54322